MHLNITDTTLKIILQWHEQLWAVHLGKPIDIPLAKITAVTTELPQSNKLGIRAPGTFLPGVIKAGTYYTQIGREFWYVTSKSNYLVLDLESSEYYRRIVLTLLESSIWLEKISHRLSNSPS